MNDICEPQPGLVLPCETHVADLVRFAREWDRQAPLLIHCWAGISRSTAAAFISLCALNPDGSELELARALRRASPTAYPNRLLVALADEVLSRNGRMIAAVEDIGRGQGRRGSRGLRAAGAACRLTAAMAARPKSIVAQETQRPDPQIELGLNAAIVTVRDGQPHILVVRPGTAGSGTWDALPFGPFAPRAHRTLEIGLREWVKRQTGLELGYVEQLYTFGDRGRHAEPGGQHTLSVGYLALTREADDELLGSHWSPWYAYFPLGGLAQGQARHPLDRSAKLFDQCRGRGVDRHAHSLRLASPTARSERTWRASGAPSRPRSPPPPPQKSGPLRPTCGSGDEPGPPR